MATETLALRGGTPVRRTPFPSWPPVTESTVRVVTDALYEGVWSDVAGERKLAFERAFADAHDARHGLAVSNGTVSLQIALAALGVGSGDEVIVPAYTFLATATSVLNVNAAPVFVDVLPANGTIDPAAVEAAITPRTKAIMPVHFGGHPADLDALMDIATRHGIPVVEDAAQAHGARWRGKAVGSFGAYGSFSFQASKNMTAGEGGALTTNDDELAELAWTLHHCGRVRGQAWYNHVVNGGNHRLGELQCAILLDQLSIAEERMTTRTRSARILDEAFAQIEGITPLVTDERVTRHAYHIYCMRYDPAAFGGLDRATFMEAMRAEGVPTSSGYISPLNRQPVFADHVFDVRAVGLDTSDPRFAYGQYRLPVSESLCEEMVIFPQYVLLGDEGAVGSIPEAVLKIQREAASLR
jgi:dTDP-4-amino-4,6-dideoxygalactose transaminase